MGASLSGMPGAHAFPSTSWSVIVAAGDPDHPDYQRNLQRLIALYWWPVFRVVRHVRRCSVDDAKDLTQSFFADVVLDRSLVATFRSERGSFRSLLRTAILRFLTNEVRFQRRKKRGGDHLVLSLSELELGRVVGADDAGSCSPEQVFDASWNEVVMEAAMVALEARMVAADKRKAFEVFRRYYVEGEGRFASYEDLGRELGLTVAQVKHALILARRTFREVVTELVRAYVDDPADLAGELRRLLGG